MRPAYYPSRLLKAVEKIKVVHPVKGAMGREMSLPDLRALILELVNCPAQELFARIMQLNLDQVCSLARYYPENYLKVNLNNIGMAIFNRCTASVIDVYIDSWQNYYNKSDNSAYLKLLLNPFNGPYRNKEQEKRFALIKGVIGYAEPAEGLVKVCRQENKSLRQFLESIPVNLKSKLAMDAFTLQYLDCSADEYEKLSLDSLKQIFDYMTVQNQGRLLNNMLTVLNDQIREHFKKFAIGIGDTYGMPGVSKNAFFWNPVGEDNKRKFKLWVNIARMDDFFGLYDPYGRASFWRRYANRCEDVFVNKRFGRIFMDFGSIHVVEFLELGRAGYFITPSNFRIFLQRYVDSEASNDEIRRTILDGNLMYGEKIVHRENWSYKVASAMDYYLRSRGV